MRVNVRGNGRIRRGSGKDKGCRNRREGHERAGLRVDNRQERQEEEKEVLGDRGPGKISKPLFLTGQYLYSARKTEKSELRVE